MPFEKGNKLGKGRPRGRTNRSTEMAKLTLARLADKGLNNINEDIEEIRKNNPTEAAKLYIKLLEFVVPKLKAIDMTVDAEVNTRIEKITVEIKNNKNDKESKEN
tara:strand:- start:3050 stop:3364 length:315 start_codon:yes stop_codon:yes gene_type:complete